MVYRKVGLIYVGISWSGFNSFGRKNCGECNFIHHGLGSIASYLNSKGIEVVYFDLRQMKDWSEFRKLIKRSNIKLFGISSTTVDFDFAKKAAAHIKNTVAKSKIVIGGVHVTVCPEDGLKEKNFDHIVSGEGEISLFEISRGIESNRMVYGKNLELSQIPNIDRELFNHRKGEMNNSFVADMNPPFTTIMTSRGCPFNCTFCQPAERMIFGGKVRLREIKDVIDEIVKINDTYGLNSFLIHDDLFLVNKKRIVEFVNLYKRSGLKASFMCQGRADLIVQLKKEIKMLKDVGLEGVMVGFESGSDRILKFLNKQTTVRINLEAAKILKTNKIKIWANYMLGIPTESYVDMLKTLLMIRIINPNYYSPSLFTPYPKTGLYDYCKKEGKIILKKHSDYRRSLSGNKIAGFNYNIIRLMIFIFLPFKNKWESISYLTKNIFKNLF